jgi:hypothetical protein
MRLQIETGDFVSLKLSASLLASLYDFANFRTRDFFFSEFVFCACVKGSEAVMVICVITLVGVTLNLPARVVCVCV